MVSVADDRSLLLTVQVRFRGDERRLTLESQACHGIERWLDHFERLTVATVLEPPELGGSLPGEWIPVEEAVDSKRVRFVPLPAAWSLRSYLGARPKVRATLAALDAGHRYVCHSFAGYLGDWGRLAAEVAAKRGRPFTLWLELVEGDVGWTRARTMKEKLRFLADSVPRIASDRYLIPKAAVVLNHGVDTLEAYRGYNPNSHEVEDIHLPAHDLLSPSRVEDKAQGVLGRRDLRVAYAGRLSEDKAPLDWIRAVHHAVQTGADVRAEWLGSGPLERQARALVASLGLEDRISLPGFVQDRERVVEALHRADLVVFTHVTRESARIQLEALNLGTPIVGYDIARARHLVSKHGGGRMAPMRDPAALGALLAELAADRPALADLQRRAARDGAQYTSKAVFEHRSKLIIDATEAALASPVALGATG